MNIVTPFPSVNINTANVYTEMLQHNNQLREVIPQPSASDASTTENKSQSDAEKAKLPGNTESATYDATGRLNNESIQQQDDENNSDNTEQEKAQEQALNEQEAQELSQIKELKARDTEVRIHEQAHAAVGGQHAGSPSYEYQRGPDGTNYAIGGEVQIDVSEVPGDPQATIDKMQTVRAAALAPAEPSSADRSIAANATQKLAAAQAELTQSKNSESNELETSSADEESDGMQTKRDEQTRDTTIEERADRIASFYQMTTLPASQSGFSAFS